MIVSFEGEDYCERCLPVVAHQDEVRPALDGVCSYCGDRERNYPEADEDSRVDPLNFDDFEEEE